MDNDSTVTNSKSKSMGVLYGFLAFTLWGFLPLYWKLLKHIPAEEILAHRILWSFVFVAALLLFSKGLGKLKSAIKDKKSLMFILFCSILITLNWGIYIWAVNANHIVEASMGYYINPLMSVLLGVSVLKEKLNLFQYAALSLATVGVIIITVQYGKIPWISLSLAITFALYGLCKKMIDVESMVGLALETVVIMPMALAFIIFKQTQGIGALGHVSILSAILLFCAGFATATPLLWFAKGAKRVELATIGFLQYISPTISLILGIFIFGEPFTGANVLSFGFIWAGLVIYSLSHTSFVRSNQPSAVKNDDGIKESN